VLRGCTRSCLSSCTRRGGNGLVDGTDRSFHVRALKGPNTGSSPVDRAGTDSVHHVITEGRGIPPAASLTGGDRHDVTQFLRAAGWPCGAGICQATAAQGRLMIRTRSRRALVWWW